MARAPPVHDLDLVSADEEVREMTIWISEERPDAGLDPACRTAPYSAVIPDLAEAIIGEVAAALNGWRSNTDRLGMSAEEMTIHATGIRSDP